MEASVECPRCHRPLASDVPSGLCPFCLLGAARVDPEATAAWEGRAGRATSSATWKEMCQTTSLVAESLTRPVVGTGKRAVAATTVVALDEFIRALIEIGLMDRAEVETYCEQFAIEPRPEAAEALARHLVRARRLTDYQAGALLQGKARGLAIANYLILDKLGKGGMGLVFKAHHRRMKKVVALKVLPPSFASDEKAVHRFRREVEAVARLGHPNIVAALDAGEFNGLHFFVMEHVEGRDLHFQIHSNGPMSVDQAIDCLTQAAHGLKAVHDKGIYHRDIKPSNLMLDSSGTLKVLDLGLARVVNEIDQIGLAKSDLALTHPGAMMGTVGFMPPEQAFDARDADHRSDIYSLGCTLFFLLTGRPPYSGDTPIACVIAHREHPIPKIRDARPEVPPRLDQTLQRMLAKAPEDRQQSIDELLKELEACRSTDLEVHSDILPSEIPTTNRFMETLRWVAVGITSVTLASGLAVTAVRLLRPDPVRKSVDLPKIIPKTPVTRPPIDVKKEVSVEPQPEPIGIVRQFNGHGKFRVEGVCVTNDGTRAVSADEDGKVHGWMVATGDVIGPTFVHEEAVLSVAISPDGLRLLSGGRDKTVRICDLKTGQEVVRFEGHEKSVDTVAYSPDGRFVLSGSGDKTVRLWEIATRKEVDRRKHDGPVTGVAFSPDGRLALSGSGDKTVRVWNLANPKGKAIQTFEPSDAVWCVAFSPRGNLVASGGPDGALTLWDLAKGAEPMLHRIEAQGWVRCVTFLRDGRHVVAGTENGELIVWDLDQKREVTPRLSRAASHLGIAAMPDGVHVLTSDVDGSVRVWRLPIQNDPGP